MPPTASADIYRTVGEDGIISFTRDPNAPRASLYLRDRGPQAAALDPSPRKTPDIYRTVGADGIIRFTKDPDAPNATLYLRGRTVGAVPDQPLLASIDKRPVDTSVAGHDSARYDPIISAAAKKHGVDAPLIKAVIRRESNFDPSAESRKGARGLMQIMPENYVYLGISDPHDPEQSIFAGTRYLREMMDRYGGDLDRALAAYNAGPAAVDRYKGVPPFEETKNFIARVLGHYYRYKNP